MGQYYKPVFLKTTKPKSENDIKGWFYSHNHKSKWTREDGTSFVSGEGLKLMEHSYIGNNLVSHVERHLVKEPQNLVWAGDYADVEPHAEFRVEVEEGKFETGASNIYGICEDAKEIKPQGRLRPLAKRYRYLVNLNKQEFVDKTKCPEIEGWEGNYIHPLPLLTCEGNNRGGGDFRAENDYIGTWARDVITVATSKPESHFKEIVPNFVE